jgi:uncharacterized protein YerC
MFDSESLIITPSGQIDFKINSNPTLGRSANCLNFSVDLATEKSINCLNVHQVAKIVKKKKQGTNSP